MGLISRPMNDSQPLFDALRNSADPAVFAAIAALVRDGNDRELCRVNVLDFATGRELETCR